MATVKLVGTDTPGTSNTAAGYFELNKFTCGASGTLTEIHIYSRVNGNVKVAIYADSAGEPGALLTANDTGHACAASQWNTLDIGDTPVTIGVVYWLALIVQTTGACSEKAGATPRRYKAAAFSTFTFPDPAGTGFTADTQDEAISGYGTALIKLVGRDDVAISSANGANYIVMTKWAAVETGSCTELRFRVAASVSGNVVIGIYTDNAGEPHVLLGQKAAAVASAAERVITVTLDSPIAITSGLNYWIAFNSTAAIVGAKSEAGVRKYKSAAYGALPNPAGTGYSNNTTNNDTTAGWGLLYTGPWHVILDGQYTTETPEINRAFVIGRDQYGNPVWGEAQDSTEIALVGERLDFQQELAIPTTAQATSTAEAILSKMRLTTKRGVILIPPNCGQELFDTVELSDAGANQAAVKFRVVGIRFEYSPKQAKYEHRLILGAP